MENNLTVSDGLTRRDLYNAWRQADQKLERFHVVLKYVFENTNLKQRSILVQQNVKTKISTFCSKLKTKWEINGRSSKKFETSCNKWLDEKFDIDDVIDIPEASTSTGRPIKTFSASSESTKRKKIQPLLESSSTDELTFATQMKLRKQGNIDAATIIKKVATTSPRGMKTMKNLLLSTGVSSPKKISVEAALAHFVDNKMTKKHYLANLKICKEHNANIWPSYAKLLECKKMCYPQNIIVQEEYSEVPLQMLLNHTIQRIAIAQKAVLEQIVENYLEIIIKWGCDGTSGFSRYKQNFQHESLDDSSMFIISLVPIQMRTQNGNLVWQNLASCSTKYCRPIKIMFTKETKELIHAEVNAIRQQIQTLQPVPIKIGEQEKFVRCQMELTMVDGKVCGNLLNVPSQNCYICGATPKMMNDPDLFKKKVENESSLSFGISSLHAWIKFFECVLHISYRLEVKTWQVKNENKEKVHERKRIIQEKLRKELGLLVDVTKPGFGSSNDGNTARKFFSYPQLVSAITGVNEELISKFGTILSVLSCGFYIDELKFEKYCQSTFQLYIDNYNWYYMPQTVHKVLVHGAHIVRSAALPIGQLSEEAQEARNKDVKYIRQYNSRKFSRTVTMEDMLHLLLVSSDPLVSSHRKSTLRKRNPIRQTVAELLKDPPIIKHVDKNNDTQDDSSDAETEGSDSFSD